MPHTFTLSDLEYRLWLLIVAFIRALLLFLMIIRFDLCNFYEAEFVLDGLGLQFVSRLLRAFAMLVSSDKTRKRAEEEKFIGELKEIERLVQRYEYSCGMYNTLKLVSNGSALNERQECLLAEATKELESLPWQVYEWVQSLENRLHKRRKNPFLRGYFFSRGYRHRIFRHHTECTRRLGCCAASCGCCHKPRGTDGPVDGLGGPFMRMLRTNYLGDYAHCSIDCGCCIRRRGFRVFTEGDGPTKQLKKEGGTEVGWPSGWEIPKVALE